MPLHQCRLHDGHLIHAPQAGLTCAQQAGLCLRYSVDDGKVRALGYAPQHRFEDGLAETVQWYKDNEAWWRPLKAKAAIG